MPPPPKPLHLRARTNKASSRATLPANGGREAPELPYVNESHEWHREAVATWEAAWQSPMSAEWLDADRPALRRWILLVDQFHKDPDTKTAAEIRQAEARFGLSPLDRRRLEWSIADEPAVETRQQASPAPSTEADPRALFIH